MYYLLSTYYPNMELNAELPSSSWPHPQFRHAASKFVTSLKVSSPPPAETFNGITTTSLLENWDKAKGRLQIDAGLSYPVTPGTNLSPPGLTVFMDTNNPVRYQQPQPASAVVTNPRTLLQNWSQVSLVGHTEMRNRERTMWQDWSTWVWMTCRSPNKVPWKKKIKEKDPPNYMIILREFCNVYGLVKVACAVLALLFPKSHAPD